MKKIGLICITTLACLSLAACGSTPSHKTSATRHSSSSKTVKRHKTKKNKDSQKHSENSDSSSSSHGNATNGNHGNRLETDREQAQRTGALSQSQMNDPSNFDADGNFTEKGWETMEGFDWKKEYNDRSWEQHPSGGNASQSSDNTSPSNGNEN